MLLFFLNQPIHFSRKVKEECGKRRKSRETTWGELHRQVKLLAVALFFFRQSVIQRHHLSHREGWRSRRRRGRTPPDGGVKQ